jgi:hypothetical protein
MNGKPLTMDWKAFHRQNREPLRFQLKLNRLEGHNAEP